MQKTYRLVVGCGVLSAMFLGVLGSPALSQAQEGATPGYQPPFGFIVATEEDRVAVGAGDTVVIDQGRGRGVRTGDRFLVLQEERRIRHPIARRLVRVPREVIGEIAVTHVQEHVATAVVITSHREINTGAALMPVAAGRSSQ